MSSMTDLRPAIADRARELQERLAAAGAEPASGKTEFAQLSWDDSMQALAETARWNGGSADSPIPRHGIQAWSEGNGQTRWMFNRMRFISLTHLAAGWVHSREPDYGQAAADYLSGWMESHPNAKDDSALNTAIRVNLHGPQGWIGTLAYFVDHPAFDADFVRRIVETARRDLEWMRTKLARTANVRLFQANSLLWAGLRLPFLDEAESWRDLGVRMLNDAAHRMIAPDGSNVEKDPHYVGVYTAIYGQAPRWTRAFPELGLQVHAEPVARLFDYAACGTKPNGFEVGLHDSVSAWEGQRENSALKARASYRAAQGLPETDPPASAFFPDAGQIFMRSSWAADASFVSVDATRRMTAHNHLGANSIQLHAHGRTLLMDPGFLTYHMGHLGGDPVKEIAGPYGKSTRAHNTLNLNGWNQWMISPEQTRHYHADGIDVVASRYAGGYWPGRLGWWFFEGGGHGIAATHDRVLVWLRDRALIVIDFMMRWNEETHGDAAHQQVSFEANWQLCPGPVSIDHDAQRVQTGHDDANLLMLFPTMPGGSRLQLFEGSDAPFRGWIGNPARDHSWLPAPQLCVSADPMQDFYGQLITVLVPYPGTTAPTVRATADPPPGPDSTQPGHLCLDWGDGSRDELWWTHMLDCALMDAAGCRTDAGLLHLRHDDAGQMTAGAIAGGTHCRPVCDQTLPTPGALSW